MQTARTWFEPEIVERIDDKARLFLDSVDAHCIGTFQLYGKNADIAVIAVTVQIFWVLEFILIWA